MNTAANGNALRVLDACRHYLGRIPYRNLIQDTGLNRLQMRDAMKTLAARGLILRCWRGVIRLTPEGFQALVEEDFTIKSGPTGPRLAGLPQTSIRSRLWRALRVAKKGSLADLLILASQGEEVSKGDAKKYMNALAAAGYLARLPAKAENGATRYLLVRDTGRVAPQWHKKAKRIHDGNTGETYELA